MNNGMDGFPGDDSGGRSALFSSGSGVFIVPDEVLFLNITVVGGGGGGAAGGAGGSSGGGGGGGGGGSGGGVRCRLRVVPGTCFPFAAGLVSAGPGVAGNISKFAGITAFGGSPGLVGFDSTTGTSGGGGAGGASGSVSVGPFQDLMPNYFSIFSGLIAALPGGGGSSASHNSRGGPGGGGGGGGVGGGATLNGANAVALGGGGGGGGGGNISPTAAGSGGNGAKGFVYIEW